MKRTLSVILFAHAAFLLSSCSDDPNILNSLDTKFTDIDIEVVVDTLEAVSAHSFRQYIPMNGFYNMLGMSGGHTAIMAMQFTQGFSERDTVEVLSAQVRLRALTWFGDSTGTLAFNAYKILRPWSSLTAIWDTVQSAGFYEESVIRGTYSGTIMADSEYVTFDLDTAMVREWLRSSIFTQYGIALVPTMASMVARGFTAFGTDSVQYVPTLTVIARNLAGTVTDTTEFTIGNDSFFGNIDNLITDPGRFYVQAGVVYRSTLSFDASSIPRGAIVNQADLILRLDRAASKLTRFSGDTLQAVHIRTSTTDSTAFETEGAIGETGPSGEFLYDIRRAAQLWVNQINNGLLIRASSLTEFSSLEQYVFHGPGSSDAAMRPKVRVVYSIERSRK